MRLPVGLDSHRRKFANEPPLDLINRFFETDPTNTLEGSALLSRPVTQAYLEAPNHPVRSLIHSKGAFQDDLFVIETHKLWRYSSTDQSWTEISDSIAGYPALTEYADTSVEAEIINGPGYTLLFCSDGMKLHCFKDGDAKSSVVPMPQDDQGNAYAAGSIAQVGKHLLIACKGTDRFYYIRPGEITIDPLHFYTAEKQSDAITAIRVLGDKVIILGDATIEFWHLSASGIAQDADVLLPYPANALTIGALPGTATVVRDMLIFIGTDYSVYGLGTELKILSPHFLAELIRLSQEDKRAGLANISNLM